MLILPMLLYGAEAWTPLNTDVAALRVFERKLLHKILGSVHILSNSQRYELLNDINRYDAEIFEDR